jgi:threonine aldolase
MRQAGVLAAAGIVALTEMVDRLAEDHANARRLAEGLCSIRRLCIDPAKVRTNIVYFTVRPEGPMAADLVELLEEAGVRVLATGPNQVRAVTHRHVSADDIDHALLTFQRIAAPGA